ncbi:SufB/SufD family protein [Acetobacterium woodii]|uniref:ABC transport system permease protein n=1 Tax=Acetobacterium woodii (strain ATCC 29683 / DSM 1030 / JCM 2381 / KCTC 1655 / WB1) TaxID=931626 RepID=H6LF67_ACEWD|nr:SufD family Fe-S cluster assembly protein [Acetobacterium woodii]AFA48167.1 ABC transport system permease protein [Acetobacterium woodii DSM 1030]
MNDVAKKLLKEVTGLEEMPKGAYNIRENSQTVARQSSENIDIVSKEDKSGIDIIVKPNTKSENVFIPALVSCSGVHDMVYNDFYIGENAEITIIAGCGVSTGDSCDGSEHNGIHRFFLGKNSKVRYVEKHIGEGTGTGKRVIDPVTEVVQEEGSYMEMETTQIKGVDSTRRFTKANLKDNAKLVIKEKLMTHGEQFAESKFEVDMDGEDSSVNLISRSVARDYSKQTFISKINGNTRCAGHSECDAIIMDHGVVRAIPEITANSLDATLIHEAAIGKIAGDQMIKLMTLGLTEGEAETQIIDGFLN